VVRGIPEALRKLMVSTKVAKQVKVRAKRKTAASDAPVPDAEAQLKLANATATATLTAYHAHVPQADRGALGWEAAWLRGALLFPKLTALFKPYIDAVPFPQASLLCPVVCGEGEGEGCVFSVLCLFANTGTSTAARRHLESLGVRARRLLVTSVRTKARSEQTTATTAAKRGQ
jgi:hypothetical protein